MKVILIKDVKNTGKKDDVIQTKDGFATYLIKNNLAVKYTSKSSEKLTNEINARNENEKALVSECNKTKKKLENITLEFKVKASESGKVFGSISSKQISEQLKKVGFDIDKKKIIIDKNINTLGMHIVKIVLHKEVTASVKVHLGSDING